MGLAQTSLVLTTTVPVNADTVAGVLLGTAVGDAIGLPFEGLSPGRIARRLKRRPLKHEMLGRRGLLSDDTEHACMVARALAIADREPSAFGAGLARELRAWLVALPPGVGFGTLRATVRLLVGFHPEHSGVFSAGNGPAMRSALLGVCARDERHLDALVRTSTRMTHTDPRAEDGARLVAGLARAIVHTDLDPGAVVADVANDQLRAKAQEAFAAGTARVELEDYRRAAGLRRGVSGFVVDSVPAAVYCWARNPTDARSAIESAVRLGGDTDTVGAITGALVGAGVGASGLPDDWVDGIRDWPLSVPHIRELALALAERRPPPRFLRWAMFPRNLAVLGVIFWHVALRMMGR